MERWITEEIKHIEIGDKRLDKRYGKLISIFSQNPGASIPEACGRVSEAKAAYRFFSSNRIEVKNIQEGIFRATSERVAKEAMVIVAQDTTNLDFTSHTASKGFGYLDRRWSRGMKVHSALAISLEGVPLGLIDQKEWVRKEEEYGKKRERKKKATQQKESQRWLDCVAAVGERVGEETAVIMVGDREADIFDLFAQKRRSGIELLIRCAHNRIVGGKPKLLFTKVLAAPVAGVTDVQVTRARGRGARTARVEVRYAPVEIVAPRHRACEHLLPVSLWAISVREIQAPPLVKPIDWMLLTTIKIETFDQAWQCVQWYTMRWLIERYHYVLKSGCQVEELQLEEADRIKRALAVYCVVAWRLLFLTYTARMASEQLCDAMLEPYEWKALHCFLQKTRRPPSTAPTINQVVQMLARLGGFLGRKGDGYPGVKVLWRGLRRLDDIAQAYLIFQRYG